MRSIAWISEKLSTPAMISFARASSQTTCTTTIRHGIYVHCCPSGIVIWTRSWISINDIPRFHKLTCCPTIETSNLWTIICAWWSSFVKGVGFDQIASGADVFIVNDIAHGSPSLRFFSDSAWIWACRGIAICIHSPRLIFVHGLVTQICITTSSILWINKWTFTWWNIEPSQMPNIVVVRVFEGSIYLTSKLRQGSTFKVWAFSEFVWSCKFSDATAWICGCQDTQGISIIGIIFYSVVSLDVSNCTCTVNSIDSEEVERVKSSISLVWSCSFVRLNLPVCSFFCVY